MYPKPFLILGAVIVIGSVIYFGILNSGRNPLDDYSPNWRDTIDLVLDDYSGNRCLGIQRHSQGLYMLECPEGQWFIHEYVTPGLEEVELPSLILQHEKGQVQITVLENSERLDDEGWWKKHPYTGSSEVAVEEHAVAKDKVILSGGDEAYRIFFDVQPLERYFQAVYIVASQDKIFMIEAGGAREFEEDIHYLISTFAVNKQ